MGIQVLDELTINKIAAGEVIDRPASVVKELIENAIDALSTSITIEIKDGGISLIRITDNGGGIPKEEIKTAFLRHATSKIRTAEDLLSVSSLGFRGEALSSIASVAMVELITKTKDAMMGCRYEIKGGKDESMEDVGVPDGTTFLVKNLFFNTPARKKFLKSSTTEAGYISDIVQRIALSHPEISIRFINNGRHMLNTSGNGNLKDVIYNIFGRDIVSNLLPIDYVSEQMEIHGFVGKPIISRGNRNFENYFINGRYIKSGIVNRAIEEGYKNFMMQHKYPFTALHFKIEPELIDVNVHPAKMELRFRNGEELYPLILGTIRDGISGKELITSVTPGKDEKPVEKVLVKPIEKTPEVFEKKRVEEIKTKAESVMAEPVEPVAQEKTQQEGVVQEKKSQEKKPQMVAEEVVYQGTSSTPVEAPKEKPQQMTLFDDKLLSKKAREHHKIVGQVFDTYWIIEYGDKMFIIDQHAAHEKVLFERTMAKLKSKETISQELNPPIILNLSLRERDMIRKYDEELRKIGYDIEEFGGNDYAVHSVPFDLYSLAQEDLLLELIDTMTEEGAMRGNSELILEKIASMSCKAAVKGNNKLSIAEANALIDELLDLENPYNCPHGRPTIISMSKYELEKKFKRIV